MPRPWGLPFNLAEFVAAATIDDAQAAQLEGDRGAPAAAASPAGLAAHPRRPAHAPPRSPRPHPRCAAAGWAHQADGGEELTSQQHLLQQEQERAAAAAAQQAQPAAEPQAQQQQQQAPVAAAAATKGAQADERQEQEAQAAEPLLVPPAPIRLGARGGEQPGEDGAPEMRSVSEVQLAIGALVEQLDCDTPVDRQPASLPFALTQAPTPARQPSAPALPASAPAAAAAAAAAGQAEPSSLPDAAVAPAAAASAAPAAELGGGDAPASEQDEAPPAGLQHLEQVQPAEPACANAAVAEAGSPAEEPAQGADPAPDLQTPGAAAEAGEGEPLLVLAGQHGSSIGEGPAPAAEPPELEQPAAGAGAGLGQQQPGSGPQEAAGPEPAGLAASAAAASSVADEGADPVEPVEEEFEDAGK